MKYLKLNFIFHLPVLGGLFFFSPSFSPSEIWAVMLLGLGAVTFVSLWANHAVERGFWNYRPGDYFFRVRHLPIEEYGGVLFPALEVALISHNLFRKFPTPPLMIRTLPHLTSLSVIFVTVVFLVAWVMMGRKYSVWIWWNRRTWSYAWHILYWFLLLWFLEWIPGWAVLLLRWPYLLLPMLLVGTYLNVVDFIFMYEGVWFADRKQTLGWRVLDLLPWERVLQNYLGCMILSQSYILLLPSYLR